MTINSNNISKIKLYDLNNIDPMELSFWGAVLDTYMDLN